MKQWKTISVSMVTNRFNGDIVQSHIIEAQCPYCDHYSTQQVSCTCNEMTYKFCPNCGAKMDEVEE